MKREREDNSSLDLTGFPYGHKVKVYFLEYEHWYDALVTKVKADQVMVTFPGWTKDEDIWLHKQSDRFDVSGGGKAKWRPVKGELGAWVRVTPEWIPTGRKLTPCELPEALPSLLSSPPRKKRQPDAAAGSALPKKEDAPAAGAAAAAPRGDDPRRSASVRQAMRRATCTALSSTQDKDGAGKAECVGACAHMGVDASAGAPRAAGSRRASHAGEADAGAPAAGSHAPTTATTTSASAGQPQASTSRGSSHRRKASAPLQAAARGQQQASGGHGGGSVVAVAAEDQSQLGALAPANYRPAHALQRLEAHAASGLTGDASTLQAVADSAAGPAAGVSRGPSLLHSLSSVVAAAGPDGLLLGGQPPPLLLVSRGLGQVAQPARPAASGAEHAVTAPHSTGVVLDDLELLVNTAAAGSDAADAGAAGAAAGRCSGRPPRPKPPASKVSSCRAAAAAVHDAAAMPMPFVLLLARDAAVAAAAQSQARPATSSTTSGSRRHGQQSGDAAGASKLQCGRGNVGARAGSSSAGDEGGGGGNETVLQTYRHYAAELQSALASAEERAMQAQAHVAQLTAREQQMQQQLDRLSALVHGELLPLARALPGMHEGGRDAGMELGQEQGQQQRGQAGTSSAGTAAAAAAAAAAAGGGGGGGDDDVSGVAAGLHASLSALAVLLRQRTELVGELEHAPLVVLLSALQASRTTHSILTLPTVRTVELPPGSMLLYPAASLREEPHSAAGCTASVGGTAAAVSVRGRNRSADAAGAHAHVLVHGHDDADVWDVQSHLQQQGGEAHGEPHAALGRQQHQQQAVDGIGVCMEDAAACAGGALSSRSSPDVHMLPGHHPALSAAHPTWAVADGAMGQCQHLVLQPDGQMAVYGGPAATFTRQQQHQQQHHRLGPVCQLLTVSEHPAAHSTVMLAAAGGGLLQLPRAGLLGQAVQLGAGSAGLGTLGLPLALPMSPSMGLSGGGGGGLGGMPVVLQRVTGAEGSSRPWLLRHAGGAGTLHAQGQQG